MSAQVAQEQAKKMECGGSVSLTSQTENRLVVPTELDFSSELLGWDDSILSLFAVDLCFRNLLINYLYTNQAQGYVAQQ